MATNGVNALFISIALAGQSGEGQRADQVSQLSGADGIVQIQCAYAGHSAGAIGDAQAFLADQGIQGGDTSLVHGLLTGHLSAMVVSHATAQQHQTHVAQRCQVTGSAQGALLRNDGGHAGVEHIHQHLHQDGAHTADAHAQSVGTQQHHATDLLIGVGITGTGAVAEDQIGGQLSAHFIGHSHGSEVTETGGDTVGHALLCRDLLCQVAGALHSLLSAGSQLYASTETCNSDKAFKSEAVTVDYDILDLFGFKHTRNHPCIRLPSKRRRILTYTR